MFPPPQNPTRLYLGDRQDRRAEPSAWFHPGLGPDDQPGLGISEITGHGVILLLEFPRLLSLYLITSSQQPPHPLPWDLSMSSFCFCLADCDPKLREAKAFALSGMKRTQGRGDIRRPEVWHWLCHLTRSVDQPRFSQLRPRQGSFEGVRLRCYSVT